ncbi:hypothetical protein HYFRA_00003748 [Hymenoscyphus fraxineus]|uniref:Uncharacterized protein n=1 Tax=Hymenoscyphus fraxineus TaxID=746836 RepID=A0A9N9KYK7_9HELO|nr:hypothetical protein HYFRA_00003748 [Hymenoscyphus fraxineus]
MCKMEVTSNPYIDGDFKVSSTIDTTETSRIQLVLKATPFSLLSYPPAPLDSSSLRILPDVPTFKFSEKAAQDMALVVDEIQKKR